MKPFASAPPFKKGTKTLTTQDAGDRYRTRIATPVHLHHSNPLQHRTRAFSQVMSLSTPLELCLGQESATTQWESKVRNFNSFAVHESGVFNCSTINCSTIAYAVNTDYAVDIPPTRTFNASMYPILSSLLGQSLNKATGTPKLHEELAGHVRQNEPGHQLQETSLHEIQQLSDLKSVDLSSSDPSLSDHEPQLPQTNLPIGMRGFCAMYATIEEPPSDDLTGDDCYGHFDFSSDPDPERPPSDCPNCRRDDHHHRGDES